MSSNLWLDVAEYHLQSASMSFLFGLTIHHSEPSDLTSSNSCRLGFARKSLPIRSLSFPRNGPRNLYINEFHSSHHILDDSASTLRLFWHEVEGYFHYNFWESLIPHSILLICRQKSVSNNSTLCL